ncbi:MAG: hypothetical protein RLZZ616_2222 [Pseudomonadota bacterium]|jgi:hypothetical protein
MCGTGMFADADAKFAIIRPDIHTQDDVINFQDRSGNAKEC